MTKKTLCILANSVKNRQSCIAGIEVKKNQDGRWQNTERWVRPISHRANGAISNAESFLLKPNRHPELFDIIEIPLQKEAHVAGQPEDWLIEPTANWQYLGRFHPKNSVNDFIEAPNDLWNQDGEKKDRVTPNWIAKHSSQSLYFIKPERFKIYVEIRDFGHGATRRRRASFVYKSVNYDFSFTDPVASSTHLPDYETREPGLQNGVSLDCLAICVSLAPAWKGGIASQEYHYKLVAGIIENNE